jgi:hypothetical protein
MSLYNEIFKTAVHNKPAVKSKESPGRKKPKNTPFSKNIMINTNANPPYSINSCGLNKSQKLSTIFNNKFFTNKAFLLNKSSD